MPRRMEIIRLHVADQECSYFLDLQYASLLQLIEHEQRGRILRALLVSTPVSCEADNIVIRYMQCYCRSEGNSVGCNLS
jgi:hypothetical protein